MNDICRDCVKADVCDVRKGFCSKMRESAAVGISNYHQWNNDGTVPVNSLKEPKVIAGIIKCSHRVQKSEEEKNDDK